MPDLEEALERLEAELSEARKVSDALTRAIRRVSGAAKTGNIAEIERSLEAVAKRGEDTADAAGKLADAWHFDGPAYLGAGYLDELRDAASDAGLQLFEKDGRIYCFPLLLRVEARETALRIGKKLERRIRPKELVRHLASQQKRPQRFKEQQFLDLLYQAYKLTAGDDWKKAENGQGPVVPLADLYKLLTLLPGSDYPIEEFGRDLLLLDRQPDLRTRDDNSFRFSGSTFGKLGVRRVTTYDEQGSERVYIGMRFLKEA
ncbi:hypothetical protein VSX64_22390 [Aurantimonas sp. C2-6-R+9]|uniref:hypothetical protein n=1 Tax=unclassified Aurantimonas TaxID=2638230 RepID=UPI002E1875B1|nr:MULTISPECIES: hypothetical protein [unclassified Aurantimonas]MEC5293776.1 hypothetical protein [Aurantimonas sp. C2-3-R2]MEC5383527.1 hypothetical protein [Aurantimonas sp. C2-6-R+9]MEC5414310.1 hypothetical protein [Aurantimonas sp. C2-4-R8]